MKKYKVFDNQTWFDVANYLFGDASKAVELAQLNNKSITEDLKAGQIIIYQSEIEKNKLVIQSMAQNQSIPATVVISELNILIPTDIGIGRMKVGSTFKVK